MINLSREGWSDWFVAVMPYGDEVRKIRQYLNMFFQKSVTKDYLDIQMRSTRKLLTTLLQDPVNFQNHIEQ